jgi:hypothetical protein
MSNFIRGIKWIESAGGPLLLAPALSIQLWGGCKPPRYSEETDYDRACKVGDYVGIIPIGDEEGLVLGDEPMQTTWISPQQNKAGMLVRWLYANDEESAIQRARTVPDEVFGSSHLLFNVRERKLLLFDSALSGSAITEEFLEVVMDPGIYRIETATYKPNENTALLVHRFCLFNATRI